MWKNIVERGRPQKTIWRMRIACRIPKATDTSSGCVILIAFTLQQWLYVLASVLRYTYIACLVFYLPGVYVKNPLPNLRGFASVKFYELCVRIVCWYQNSLRVTI
jgi:hypothetical protein